MQPAGGGLLSSSFVDLRQCSASAVLALNNVHHVETSWLDEASYGVLVDAAGFAVAVGQKPDAFLIAFNEASVHDNGNLAWFRQCHARFFYVDRIIVADHARGRGLARALYAALFEQARAEGRMTIGCEINVLPPNPGSDALHEALGFRELERIALPGGKIIRYMRRDLG
jgi:uncharacterized protein